MTWIWLSIIAALLGGELNAVAHEPFRERGKAPGMLVGIDKVGSLRVEKLSGRGAVSS